MWRAAHSLSPLSTQPAAATAAVASRGAASSAVAAMGRGTRLLTVVSSLQRPASPAGPSPAAAAAAVAAAAEAAAAGLPLPRNVTIGDLRRHLPPEQFAAAGADATHVPPHSAAAAAATAPAASAVAVAAGQVTVNAVSMPLIKHHPPRGGAVYKRVNTVGRPGGDARAQVCSSALKPAAAVPATLTPADAANAISFSRRIRPPADSSVAPSPAAVLTPPLARSPPPPNPSHAASSPALLDNPLKGQLSALPLKGQLSLFTTAADAGAAPTTAAAISASPAPPATPARVKTGSAAAAAAAALLQWRSVPTGGGSSSSTGSSSLTGNHGFRERESQRVAGVHDAWHGLERVHQAGAAQSHNAGMRTAEHSSSSLLLLLQTTHRRTVSVPEPLNSPALRSSPGQWTRLLSSSGAHRPSHSTKASAGGEDGGLAGNQGGGVGGAGGDGTEEEEYGQWVASLSSPYSFIRAEVRRDGRVGLITLARPKALNALSQSVMSEVVHAATAMDKRAEVGAIVITGEGRAFAAGADIAEMRGYTMVAAQRQQLLAGWDKLARVRKPTIAAVNGYALGGGCELAMMCDIILAGERAVFGQPEVKLGVIPGMGGTQRLVRAVGKSRAMEMVLTGEAFLSASEAVAAGLASRVVSGDDSALVEEALSVGEKVARLSQPVVAMAKECVNAAMEGSLREGLLRERAAFYSCFALGDQTEGMSAFLEKRGTAFRNE